MSGLLVFLMGLVFLMIGLTQAALPKNSLQIVIWLAGIIFGAFFVFSGLRIRKLKFRTLPVSLALWFVLNISQILFVGVGLGAILTLLIGLMALCGLRGWFWLRDNGCAEPLGTEAFD